MNIPTPVGAPSRKAPPGCSKCGKVVSTKPSKRGNAAKRKDGRWDHVECRPKSEVERSHERREQRSASRRAVTADDVRYAPLTPTAGGHR